MFFFFQFEQHGCEFDKVEVQSKMSEDSFRSHGIFCGTWLPPPVTSETNSLRLEFTSDGTMEKSGFAAVFFTGQLKILNYLTNIYNFFFQTLMNALSIMADASTSVKTQSVHSIAHATTALTSTRTVETVKKAAVSSKSPHLPESSNHQTIQIIIRAVKTAFGIFLQHLATGYAQ